MMTRRTFETGHKPRDPAPAFAAKATDLQALRDGVDAAAAVGGGLWLSYLFTFLYLAIAAGAVTHKDLFLESPVKLPFLNVELPLLAFFVLAPLLFVILHAYTLLHFTMLADKVGAFDDALQGQIDSDDTRTRLRRQLPSNIFVQFLAGPRYIRHGPVGWMLRGVALISLVIGPIFLLVFFQLQFLPYHDWAISWWQRGLVVADLILLWLLWPSIAGLGQAALRWRDLLGPKPVACLTASAVPLLLVFTIATFPGEWLNEHLPQLEFPRFWEKAAKGKRNFTSLHKLLIDGEIDLVKQRPQSLRSNRLVLPGTDFIDRAKFDSDAKFAAVASTVSLRGRNLERAILIEARLRKADFTGAVLAGANFQSADLRDAKFECNQAGGTSVCADLQGASLFYAQLQGASLFNAQLQGASLFDAQLQGASLVRAQLQGARLDDAQLQGARLDDAQLQGASLDRARLQGASLDRAQLQGARLVGARLQGASLDNAQLQGAILVNVAVWRTAVRDMGAGGARIVRPEIRGLTRDEFTALQLMTEKEVPERARADALARIARLNPDDKEIDAMPDPGPSRWDELEKESPPKDRYEEGLAVILKRTGCAAPGAPYVIRGLSRFLSIRFSLGSPHLTAVAKAFLEDNDCAGARGLPDEDKARLRQIVARAVAAANRSVTPR